MATVKVSTPSEMWSAIRSHGAGDVVDATAVRGNNSVPQGTLDGEGVTVRTNERKKGLFVIDQPHTTVKNITLEGDKTDEILKNGYWDYPSGSSAWASSAEGIVVRTSDALIEDVTCRGWTHAGIQVGSSKGGMITPTIRRCLLVDNNAQALGYGCAVYSGHPTIEWCYMDNNRHDIAGSGRRDCGYTAQYNHVGERGRLYGFEMHEPGGNYVIIRNNTFERKKNPKGTPRSLIVNRGTPQKECPIEYNWFKGKDQDEVTSLLERSPELYKFRGNSYGPSEPDAGVGQPRYRQAMYDAVAAAATLSNVR